MALQTSGQITINDIITEFGGSAPHGVNEYYRGGSYVGSGNTGVPTSGEIQLTDFYGASARDPALTSASSAYTGTSGTFSIGNAHADRIVLVAHASRYGGSPVASVNGISMTGIGTNGGGIGQEKHCLLYANVPTGTSATVTFSSFGGSSDRWSGCAFVPTNTSPTWTADFNGSTTHTRSTTPDSDVLCKGYSAYGSASSNSTGSTIYLDNNTRGFGGKTVVTVASGTSTALYGGGYNATAAHWV